MPFLVMTALSMAFLAGIYVGAYGRGVYCADESIKPESEQNILYRKWIAEARCRKEIAELEATKKGASQRLTPPALWLRDLSPRPVCS